jgi:hypothetical protein
MLISQVRPSLNIIQLELVFAFHMESSFMFAGIPVPQTCGINGKHKLKSLCVLCVSSEAGGDISESKGKMNG